MRFEQNVWMMGDSRQAGAPQSLNRKKIQVNSGRLNGSFIAILTPFMVASKAV